MFTEIGIENFKAFGKMQRVPLKPITLLYGPNSSGKSSLMQALLLLKQTLEETGDDKIVLLPKGNLVDLGDYQEFINGQDNKKVFRIAVSFKYYKTDFFPGWEPGKADSISLDFSFSLDKSKQVFVRGIKVQEALSSGPIAEYKNVWLVNHLKRAVLRRKAEFERDKDDPKLIREWLSDLRRSVLVLDSANLQSEFCKAQWEGLLSNYGIKNRNTGGITDLRWQTEDEMGKLKELFEKNKAEIATSKTKLQEECSKQTEAEHEGEENKIRVAEAKCRQIGQVLRLVKIIDRSLSSKSYDEISKLKNLPQSNRLISLSNCFPNETGELSGAEELFQSIPHFASIGAPLRQFRGADHFPIIYGYMNPAYLLPWASSLLKDYLRDIIYIGPLREYLERVYSYSGNIRSTVGKSGKFAPDILFKRPDLVDKVDKWFNQFKIGYTLKVNRLKKNLFELLLSDRSTGVKVSPKDVGFGISQILPVLVQGALSENQIILIEQPEIHVHPRLQAELGSFFAEMAGRTSAANSDPYASVGEGYGNQFIIETHSENLILRLQKLIRKGELKKEDVAVIYCDKSPEGTVATELRLNDKGEFIDPWPHGFFEESFDELFGE